MNQLASDRARVLIVDDLETNRDLLARRVSRLGHETGFAANGFAALEELRASPWDMVLLDITMPEMDGYEALRQIKADPALSHLPVIMVSAVDEIDSVVRCIELGADDFLPKPFNPVLLRARIESSLNKKRLEDQRQETLRALARELDIGRRIQTGFLPATLPQLEGWQLAAHCEPARQVGGDFYDALRLPDGRLAITVADVCDKGVGAALYMALFRSLLRTSLLQAMMFDDSHAMLVRTVTFTNDYIASEHGRDSMFATIFIALLEPSNGMLHWINAGHEAPILWRADGGFKRLPPSGPAVGMLHGMEYGVRTDTIRPGDLLIGFSDGISDALGPSGLFGEGRILEPPPPSATDAHEVVDTLLRRVREHVGGHAQQDDITLLALRARA
jgi:sigma-B regulation protein RsbU (phosphoserine phosphatase)